VLTLNVCSSIEDSIGEIASKCLPRFGITLLICIFGFLAGLGFTTQVFSFLVQRRLIRIDSFGSGRSLRRGADGAVPAPADSMGHSDVRADGHRMVLLYDAVQWPWFIPKTTRSFVVGGHLLARDVRQMVGRSYCWIMGYLVLDWVYLLPAVPVVRVVRAWLRGNRVECVAVPAGRAAGLLRRVARAGRLPGRGGRGALGRADRLDAGRAAAAAHPRLHGLHRVAHLPQGPGRHALGGGWRQVGA